MSYMTKDQLENYLNGLPSSNNNGKKEPSQNNYNSIRSELIYPMSKLSVQEQQQQQQQQEIDQEAYGTIQDRMKRLRNATGTVMNATQTVTPAFPETPKPAISSTKPNFNTKSRPDAFEASLTPRSYSYKPPVQPKPKLSPPLPPPLPTVSPSTPPPAVPNSPRPQKPTKERVSTLNPIYAGLDCPKCHEPIEGSVVSALDQIWHAHCFTCSTCHKPLEKEQFFEKNEQPYCKKDYQNLFSLHCDFCHDPIEQQAISALGKHYHEGHFCCTACKEPFGDHSAFMVHEDKPYCQEDYMKICGKKCSGCGQYMSGEYINALDQEWHKSCFVCTDCKKPFTGGSFLVRDNTPYCEEHYHHPITNKPTQRQQPQQQNVEQRKPPPLKPKPSIGKKPDLPSPSPSRTEESYKRPDISNRSSLSNINAKSTAETRPSAKVCHQCNQMIDGPSASALGHDYHIHHFQCSDCSRALSSRVPGMWQGDENGELVCKMCAFKRTQQ